MQEIPTQEIPTQEIPTQEFIKSCCHYVNIGDAEGEANDVHNVLLVHNNTEFLMPALNDPAGFAADVDSTGDKEQLFTNRAAEVLP